MSGQVLDALSAKLANSSPWLAKDEQSAYKVVGVSFQSKNFEDLKRLLGKSDGQESEVPVVLRHEPENPYSESRSSIAVYSNGVQLGHLPEVAAKFFADLLKLSGGLARADARVYFGPNSNNSLQLKIQFPPRFEGEEPKEFDLIYLTGDGEYRFSMRTRDYPICWERLSGLPYPVQELEIGETYFGEDGLLTVGEFGRRPSFSCMFGHIAKPRIPDEYAVNTHLGAIGGQARVRYKLVRTTEERHTVSLDWNLKVNRSSAMQRQPIRTENRSVDLGSLSLPRRWPDDPEHDALQTVDANRAKERRKDALLFEKHVFSKILKIFGKVLFYATFGIFIVSFMLVVNILEDSVRAKSRKQ